MTPPAPATLPDFIACAIADDGMARWNDRQAAERVLAMPEMQAIRKALQAAETVIAHADDPARQQTKIEYLSWALVDLSDAVQAWVLEDEQ